MSKAEEKAMKKYPPRSVLIVPARGGGYYADKHLRDGYIEGYKQAEKDNELTWENMMLLEDILEEMLGENMNDKIPKEWGLKEYYQEVLKRFKSYGKKEI